MELVHGGPDVDLIGRNVTVERDHAFEALEPALQSGNVTNFAVFGRKCLLGVELFEYFRPCKPDSV